MTECDNCNRPICHGCPYQEPKKTMPERFADKLATNPDNAIEWLAEQDIDCVIKELIEIYWRKNKVYALREINRRIK